MPRTGRTTVSGTKIRRDLSRIGTRRSSSGRRTVCDEKEQPMKFAMLICGDDQEWSTLSPAAEEDLMKQIFGWYEQWQPTGKIADGGVELQPRDTAKTVRAGADGRPVVTDGPYVELKEVVGGVVVLECDDIDEAARVAATWPLGAGMTAIEVRPVMSRE
jgi:hypothetical protein